MTSNPTILDLQQQRDNLSALQLTRAAIARWRGAPVARVLPQDASRVSPQARHMTQAVAGLDAWIAAGGFGLDTDPVSPAPAPERTRKARCTRLPCTTKDTCAG
ncbi:MAG TPA: hypothetical protein VGC21_15115 [Telluria sp.]